MSGNQEDRRLDLIDELWELNDDLQPGEGTGVLFKRWAQKTVEYETEARDEERAAVLALLEHSGAPKSMIDMIAAGVHRQRSTKVMKAIKTAKPEVQVEPKLASVGNR